MIFTQLIILIVFPLSSSGGKWTYNGPDGEAHWSKHYPYCGGAFQSPIDFQPELLRYDPDLLPIQVYNYNLSSNEQLTLSNNGHSVQLSLPSHMHLSSLRHLYTAAQLHLHWGSPDILAGSEHTVNGRQFAAEMHVVHFNSGKYPNISIAADKSDGLAVLGVFIEVGEFNPAFDRFLKFVKGIRYRDQKVQVPAFNIQDLLPAQLDRYYRYDGSLTTPPCYPSVLWTVFSMPVTISLKQYKALATGLFSSQAQEFDPVPLLGNYRKPQLTDNRVVLVSFQEVGGQHGSLLVASPMQRRLIIQQLLMGDVADVMDEGVNHLLPQLAQKRWAAKKWKNNHRHPHWSQVTEKKQNNQVSGTPGKTLVWKNTHISPFWGKHGINEDSLSYIYLEKNVTLQLSRHHTDIQVVKALRKAVFPQLNLQSYLNCKSDLDLQTIRCLLRTRLTDESTELEQALTIATLRQKQKPMAEYHGSALTKLTGQAPVTIPKNAHSMAPANLREQPTELED
ncbi:carbonic anhydrase 12 [Electrophorus electricus]|uniref:Carbonic anhydrase n=1 Tax=Electrophorus electricus TaxID=8005 RepID=A0A4W4DUL1_ELEEL|nr:carbonic anhydrase 12 [Electrophorus electricus]